MVMDENDVGSTMVASPQKVRAWQFVLPFAIFILLTQAESFAMKPDGSIHSVNYVAVYCLKILSVGVSLWFCRPALRDFKPRPNTRQTFVSVLLGLFIGVFWVLLDGHYPALPESVAGKRSAFDPMQLEPIWKYLFLAFRMTGLVLFVPVIEELFIRDFLLRYVTNPDWEELPAWQFSTNAAVVSTGLFVAGHPEWLPALLCGLIWLWLLRLSQNLRTLVISHSVANLCLGVYSIATADWHFL